jgi:hypothetical protein
MNKNRRGGQHWCQPSAGKMSDRQLRHKPMKIFYAPPSSYDGPDDGSDLSTPPASPKKEKKKKKTPKKSPNHRRSLDSPSLTGPTRYNPEACLSSYAS